MKDLILLSPKTSVALRWSPPSDFSFLEGASLLPVQAAEAGRVAATLPLALCRDDAQPSGWEVMAVCGQQPDNNMMIDVSGQWVGRTVVESLRYLPFALRSLGRGKAIAAINTRYAGKLMVEDGSGVPVYDEGGRLHPIARQRLDFLTEHQPKVARTQGVLTKLAQADLITAWPETALRVGGITLEGLHTIDEKKLSALDDETFLELRKSGALALAYSCLLSLYQVRNLAAAASSDKSASQSAIQTTGDLDIEFLNDDDTIKFGPLH